MTAFSVSKTTFKIKLSKPVDATIFETLGFVLVGYARVSTEEQSLDLQMDALAAAKCEKVFEDVISSRKEERPQLRAALQFVREGDTLIVWRLDRLGRSVRELIEIIGDLEKRSVGFRSIQEDINTTTPGGKLVFHVFAALAEFERELISQRTKAGLSAAKARGRSGGRPPKLSVEQIEMAKRLETAKIPHAQICETLGISRSTLYRVLKNPQ